MFQRFYGLSKPDFKLVRYDQHRGILLLEMQTPSPRTASGAGWVLSLGSRKGLSSLAICWACSHPTQWRYTSPCAFWEISQVRKRLADWRFGYISGWVHQRTLGAWSIWHLIKVVLACPKKLEPRKWNKYQICVLLLMQVALHCLQWPLWLAWQSTAVPNTNKCMIWYQDILCR